VRKLLPRVVMMVAVSARRSRRAVVTFSSPPTTLGHSPKASLVVRTTERGWCRALMALKRDLAAGTIEGDEADLVEDEDVHSFEASLVATELASVARLEERAHEVGGAPEGNVAPLPRGVDTERDCQVRLAGVDGAGEDHVAVLGDPVPAGQVGDDGGVDAVAAAKSKASRVLSSGKRAWRTRSRTAESWREVCSTERHSCR
jgi:hypothetical protein